MEPLDIDHFNPHPRTEDDQEAFHAVACRESISIHILAQRMTVQGIEYRIVDIDFNPQPRIEDDLCF